VKEIASGGWPFVAWMLCFSTAGCVYYNSVYNAERALAQADAHRLAGEDSLARKYYEDARRKSTAGFRKDPEGEWASAALLIAGRSTMELGRPDQAAPILTAAVELAGDKTSGAQAAIHLADALRRQGRPRAALDVISPALRRLDVGPSLAQGHILRAELRLVMGMAEGAAGDFRLAAGVSPEFAAWVALARLRHGIERNRYDWRAEAMAELFIEPSGWRHISAALREIDRVAERWGEEEATVLLAGAEAAEWPSDVRNDVALVRVGFFAGVGQPDEVLEEIHRVEARSGNRASTARIRLAERALAKSLDSRDFDGALEILAPINTQPRAAELLFQVEELRRLVELASSEPLALFAAAEIARDEIGAKSLALGMFRRYLEIAGEGDWTGKAALAAMDLTPKGDPAGGDLLGWMERHPQDPYLRASMDSDGGHRVAALEVRLKEKLNRLRERAPDSVPGRVPGVGD